MIGGGLRRSEAIARLVREDIAELSSEEAAELLLDYWGLDVQEQDELALPEELQAQLRELDAPPSFDREVHLPLLELGLRAEYSGVRNEYLEQRLLRATGRSYAVVGALEPMQQCPCCGYRSLRERGGYEICPVCFWEDDGSDVLDGDSAANRMSLAEAMQNFRALGSVDARYLPHLRADRMERFPRT